MLVLSSATHLSDGAVGARRASTGGAVVTALSVDGDVEGGLGGEGGEGVHWSWLGWLVE